MGRRIRKLRNRLGLTGKPTPKTCGIPLANIRFDGGCRNIVARPAHEMFNSLDVNSYNLPAVAFEIER